MVSGASVRPLHLRHRHRALSRCCAIHLTLLSARHAHLVPLAPKRPRGRAPPRTIRFRYVRSSDVGLIFRRLMSHAHGPTSPRAAAVPGLVADVVIRRPARGRERREPRRDRAAPCRTPRPRRRAATARTGSPKRSPRATTTSGPKLLTSASSSGLASAIARIARTDASPITYEPSSPAPPAIAMRAAGGGQPVHSPIRQTRLARASVNTPPLRSGPLAIHKRCLDQSSPRKVPTYS
jgi:hypothetical protein